MENHAPDYYIRLRGGQSFPVTPETFEIVRQAHVHGDTVNYSHGAGQRHKCAVEDVKETETGFAAILTIVEHNVPA